MKRFGIIILLLLAIGASIFVSCEKEAPDYRLKWVGTYKCQKESDLHGDSTIMVYLDVAIANGDSLLDIDERRDSVNHGTSSKYLNYTVKVSAYGDMKWHSRSESNVFRFYATFYKDSIYVYHSNGYALGAGWMPTFIYKGVKIL
ncbi:MAG: hypothetical protein IJK62_11170 [Bacteroidales bacterium]|nr:hypothetical protein [Bacteroidales bacterium]